MPRGKPKTLAEEKAELDARIAKRVAELLKARDAATDELKALGHKEPVIMTAKVQALSDIEAFRESIERGVVPRAPTIIRQESTGNPAPQASSVTADATKEAARQQNAGYQRGGILGTETDLDIPDALRNARANLKGVA